MQESVERQLAESLRRQALQHHKQAERQSRPSQGFLFKVNGTQLKAAAAKLRKRSRENSGNVAEDRDDEWPHVLLGALVQVVADVEQEESSATPKNDTLGASSSSLTASALTSLTGVEVRHGNLQARHICAPGDGREVCLTPWLLSPSRLWNRTVVNASAAAPLLCPFLTTLDLECNALRDDGVAQLCTNALPFLPQLQRLLLASNGVTAAGFVALLRALSLPGTSAAKALPLEVLGLTNNAVGGCCAASEFDAWVNAVQSFAKAQASTLRRVHLNHAGLSSRDAAVLIEALLRYAHTEADVCVFDLVYLRENTQLSKGDVMAALYKAAPSTDRVTAFVAQHVSW